jgi:predicted metal-dependent enzyme (double-stranded beta helix superfamily)
MNRVAANPRARRSSSSEEITMEPDGLETFIDDDVHAVAAVGNEPTVGIHVYGGNIGTIRRRSYDPATGEARWFVSGWDSPEGGTPQVRSNL